ncbi:MAG: TolB family protein [Chloroflexota bacterium]
MSQSTSDPSTASLQTSPPQRKRWILSAIFMLIFVCLAGVLVLRFYPPFTASLQQMFTSVLSQSTSAAAWPTSTSTTAPVASLISPSPTLQVFTATATEPAPPPATSPAGSLVISLLDSNHYHLFLFQPDTHTFLRLTSGEWDDITPAVSPDGSLLAFASNRRGYWDLYLFNLSTGDLTPLTLSPEYDAAPSWSPDGKWLVYHSYVANADSGEGNLELLIRDVTTSDPASAQPLRLTDQRGGDFSPAWSPSGRQIAFVSQRAGENDIWLADLDKVEDRFTNLSRNPLSPDAHPRWSPDGRWLAWDAQVEGISYIYLWDAASPQTPIEPRFPGKNPLWSADGQILFVEVSTPNRTYLTAYALAQDEPILPLLPLHSSSQGSAWLKSSPSLPNLSIQEPAPPPWQPSLSLETPIPANRQHVVRLNDVQAPFPYLHDLVDESFQALRSAVQQASGWDALSRLENAYIPLTSPPFAAIQDDWLYTGRAIALDTAIMNAGWLVAVREEYGSEIYWRVFLKTRFQDGSQGQPLLDLPWDINARYSGDPLAYEQGGAYLSASPSGYWVDLTELANRYGWERLPALASWRLAAPSARFNQFVWRGNATWYDAMMELYPPEALYTATPPPPPTPTPTKAPFPSRTPTPTTSPFPTQTPLTLTATP